MRVLLSRAWLALWRWKVAVPTEPVPAKCVMIAAPHTSNWDFPLTLAMARVSGVRITWLGKAQLFRGPMGPIMRRLGGIAVTRESAGGMVETLAAEFARRDRLCLVVPAEGTRSHREYWKSGFYHVARAAGVPVLCGFVDRSTRTGGFGPAVPITGDMRADMDVIRAFYAGKTGLRPGRHAVPRLRDEEPASPT